MSRSYKKTPVIKDRSHNNQHIARRLANKRVRKISLDSAPNDKRWYKKVSESYNISDWRHWNEDDPTFRRK